MNADDLLLLQDSIKACRMATIGHPEKWRENGGVLRKRKGEKLATPKRKQCRYQTRLRTAGLVLSAAALFLAGGGGVFGGINDVFLGGKWGIASGDLATTLCNRQPHTTLGTRLILGKLQRPTRTMV
jgi:hypothetical protein